MNSVRTLMTNPQIISLIIVIISLFYYFTGKSTWYYYPIYFLGIFHFFIFILNYFQILRVNRFTTIVIISLTLFLPLLTYFSIAVFPIGELPTPRGFFKIGTKLVDLTDEGRKEIYGEKEKAVRKIKYQIWYPADEVDDSKRAKWLKDGTLLPRNLIKTALVPMPSFILDQAAGIESHAYYEAEISEKTSKYPVVLISHGWKSFSELHTDFAEDLASNGYIVFTIEHSYGAQAVKFNDGSVAYLDKDALPRIITPSKFTKAARKLAITYGKDIEMVLNDLERLNREDKDFKDKLDLEKVGLLGHSAGGAGVVYTGLKDDRIKALVGLDAMVNPLDSDELAKGLEPAALFMRSQQWGKRQSKKPLNQMIKHSTNAQVIELEGTNHIDYSLLYVFSPYIKSIGLNGQHAGEEFSLMQRKIARTFFDKELKNKDLKQKYLQKIFDQYEYIKTGEIKD